MSRPGDGPGMEPLDIDGGFDVHAHRHGLKLLKQDVDTWELANPDDNYACPSCGRAFDRLFVSAAETITFGSAPSSPICLARTPEQILLTTHPDGATGGA